MMVINTGDPFPDLAVVVLARWAWRYRSELAPARRGARHWPALAWLHARALPQWWPLILRRLWPPRAQWPSFGARSGSPGSPNALYAAARCSRRGGVAGRWPPRSARSPRRCRKSLGIGALVLAVPWWAHRRRRAKVRVERTLAAWPDIAKAIGLPGSQVMSATRGPVGMAGAVPAGTRPDHHRRDRADSRDRIRARHLPRRGPRLPDPRRPGQPVRAAGAGHRPARRRDPVARPVRHVHHPAGRPRAVRGRRAVPRVCSCAGTRCSAAQPGRARAAGSTCSWPTWPPAATWSSGPSTSRRGWNSARGHACIDRLATTPEQAAALLADAVAILQARAAHLAATGRRIWEPSPDMPALVIIIDEYAELADEAPDAMSDTDSIARLGRAVAVTLVAATQRPTQKAMGQGAVRSQMDTADMLPRPRTQRRRPGPRPGNAQRRMARPQPQRARQVPRLRTRARHAHARPRLPGHR